MAKLRRLNVTVVAIAVTLSTAAFVLTYTVAMVPYDQPNAIIVPFVPFVPFVPGFLVYQLLNGFQQGPIPDGIGGFSIAATNALFYGAVVFALYRIFRKHQSRRSLQ